MSEQAAEDESETAQQSNTQQGSSANRKIFIYRKGIVTFGATFEELKAELSGKAQQTVEVMPIIATLNSSRGPVTGDF